MKEGLEIMPESIERVGFIRSLLDKEWSVINKRGVKGKMRRTFAAFASGLSFIAASCSSFEYKEPQTKEWKQIMEKYQGNCYGLINVKDPNTETGYRYATPEERRECNNLLGKIEGEREIKSAMAIYERTKNAKDIILTKRSQAWQLKKEFGGRNNLDGFIEKWKEFGGKVEPYDIGRAVKIYEQMNRGDEEADREFYEDLWGR